MQIAVKAFIIGKGNAGRVMVSDEPIGCDGSDVTVLSLEHYAPYTCSDREKNKMDDQLLKDVASPITPDPFDSA